MVKREKKNHLNSLRSNHQLCKRGVCRRRQRVPPAEHQSQVLSSNCTFSTKLFSSQSLPSQRAAGACDLKPTSPAANPTTVHATSPAPVSTERERELTNLTECNFTLVPTTAVIKHLSPTAPCQPQSTFQLFT